MSLLELRSVAKRFGGIVAVKDVSACVESGDIVGLIGANGAGKTTLFSIIAGNQHPSAGEVVFDGASIGGLRPDQVSALGIARTFQIVRPFRNLTVLENVETAAMFGARRASAGEARRVALGILDQAGLAGRAGQLAGELTLAGRKRLEIARALATRPRLLLLDEVLAGLTPAEMDAAVDIVRSVHAGTGVTILMVEHVLSAVMRLCHRVIVLHHGEKIAEGTPVEVANDPAVITAYIGAARA
jgi:branched-chain amino acid transport system ATP-binding protein